MDVKVEIKYRLDLNREEWLLVSRALRGQLTAEDQASARALQEQMLTQKHNVLSQMAGEAGKAVANVTRAKGDFGGDEVTRTLAANTSARKP